MILTEISMKLLLTSIVILFCVTTHAQTTLSPPLNIPSTQPTYGDFNIVYSPFDVNGETHQDHVARFGWNCSAAGSPAILGKGQLCLEWESHYRPGGPTDAREWGEFHVAAANYIGTVTRPLSILHDKNTNGITTILRSGNLNVIDDSGVGNLQLYSKILMLLNGTKIRNTLNNVEFMEQYNAVGTGVIPIARVSNADRVVVGGATFPVEVGTLYLKDGTSKQVTWADNDSCGVGYKCLRISN